MSDEEMSREIRNMRERGDQITDESLESTRRMLKTAIKTQDVGNRTLDMLDKQGEQLDRIEDPLDVINVDMQETEKNLTNLEKCCGLCVCPGSRAKKFENTVQYKKAYGGKEKVVTNQPGGSKGNGRQQNPSGGFVQRITNDAREDEMDANLAQVGDIVGNLKSMAVDMGKEIDAQNRQIDRIKDKAESNDVRIAAANTRARQFLQNA